MAAVTQSFDVKISIIRPFVTKNLSIDDLQKINQTTNLKYESLKTITPQGFAQQDAAPSDTEILSELDKSLAELDTIRQNFDDLAERAAEALNKIVYTYDVSNPEFEITANAERAIFGSASGVITFAKYKKILAFEEVLNREMQERMVNNGGILNGVA